jgi:hypothetical protein
MQRKPRIKAPSQALRDAPEDNDSVIPDPTDAAARASRRTAKAAGKAQLNAETARLNGAFFVHPQPVSLSTDGPWDATARGQPVAV